MTGSGPRGHPGTPRSIARGILDQSRPIFVDQVALMPYGVGIFGGYQVAFRGVWGPPRGAIGMWLMQSVGLGLAGVLLLGFYVWLRRQGDASQCRRA